MSYPVGAERISLALVGVPQYSELRLYFGATRKHQTRAVHPTATTTAPFPVLEVGYRNSLRENSEVYARLGLPALEWSVEAIGVPRPFATRVRELLLNEGLELARKWLAEPRTKTWLDASHHRVALSYDPLAEALTLAEGT